MIFAFLNKQTGKGKLVVCNPWTAIFLGSRMRKQGFTRVNIASGSFDVTNMVPTNPKIENCYSIGEVEGGLT